MATQAWSTLASWWQMEGLGGELSCNPHMLVEKLTSSASSLAVGFRLCSRVAWRHLHVACGPRVGLARAPMLLRHLFLGCSYGEEVNPQGCPDGKVQALLSLIFASGTWESARVWAACLLPISTSSKVGRERERERGRLRGSAGTIEHGHTDSSTHA